MEIEVFIEYMEFGKIHAFKTYWSESVFNSHSKPDSTGYYLNTWICKHVGFFAGAFGAPTLSAPLSKLFKRAAVSSTNQTNGRPTRQQEEYAVKQAHGIQRAAELHQSCLQCETSAEGKGFLCMLFEWSHEDHHWPEAKPLFVQRYAP